MADSAELTVHSLHCQRHDLCTVSVMAEKDAISYLLQLQCSSQDNPQEQDVSG